MGKTEKHHGQDVAKQRTFVAEVSEYQTSVKAFLCHGHQQYRTDGHKIVIILHHFHDDRVVDVGKIRNKQGNQQAKGPVSGHVDQKSDARIAQNHPGTFCKNPEIG